MGELWIWGRTHTCTATRILIVNFHVHTNGLAHERGTEKYSFWKNFYVGSVDSQRVCARCGFLKLNGASDCCRLS